MRSGRDPGLRSITPHQLHMGAFMLQQRFRQFRCHPDGHSPITRISIASRSDSAARNRLVFTSA